MDCGSRPPLGAMRPTHRKLLLLNTADPPPLPSPPSIYRSAHCEPSREQTVKVASFSSPLLIRHPSTAVSFNELSFFFFFLELFVLRSIFLAVKRL